MSVTDLAVTALREQLRSSVVLTPGSAGYLESLRRWSDTGAKQAAVVVQPVDIADVRAALLWAQEHRVDLAIKGGGHSVAGTSSSEGGLVVDLCRMNGVTVDAANRTVTAQGGATWKEVDETAAAHGLATVGGTVNHTGVGGLTLGGGYGWLSGQYGLTIDNLLGATVVLADGRVVHASDDSEYSDLFWGLRGAGYNFGVVVDFTYRAYEQTNPVLAGIVAFPPDKLEAVVAALNKFLANPDEKAGAMCVFAQPPGAPGPMVNVVCVYNGTREAGEKRFAALLAEQPVVNTLAMVPYAELNALQNPMTSYGDRKSFKGLFFRPPLDAVFVRRIFSEFSAKVLGDPDLAASSLILEFVDMRKICAVSRTATAFASRNSTQNGVLCLRWTDAGKDAEHRLWARECQARWKAQLDAQVSGGDAEVPQYINYAEPGDSAVANIYGENLSRLQQLKAKYDPGNVFHKMHPITAAK